MQHDEPENDGSEFEEKNFLDDEEGGGPEDGAAENIVISSEELFWVSTESIDNAVSHIAEGGNILDFCKLYGIKVSTFWRWVEADAERGRLMAEAEKMKERVVIEKVYREIDRISNFDIREIFDINGCVKPPEKWSDAAGAVIAGIEVKESRVDNPNDDADENPTILMGRVVKVKLWDKTKMVDMVAKIKALIGEKDKNQDQTGLLKILQDMHRRRLLAAKSGGQIESRGLGSGAVIDVTPAKDAEKVGV
jgi:hypothetical protein